MIGAVAWLVLVVCGALVSTLVRENAAVLQARLAPLALRVASALCPRARRAVRREEWAAEVAAVADAGRPLTALLMAVGMIRGALIARVATSGRGALKVGTRVFRALWWAWSSRPEEGLRVALAGVILWGSAMSLHIDPVRDVWMYLADGFGASVIGVFVAHWFFAWRARRAAKVTAPAG